MKNLVAANWKMNKDPEQSKEYFHKFMENLPQNRQSQAIFFTPATSLYVCADFLNNTNVGWGTQNVYFEKSGAYTGETSPEVAKNMGATYGLVGHSERRQYFGETDEDVNKKSKVLLAQGMIPMVCVGETLNQRDGGETFNVLGRQVQMAFEGIGSNEEFVVAYEPVWAIGTGKVATPEIAEEAHLHIRNLLVKLFGESKGSACPILYGGSVKPENAQSLIDQKNINGFLVGGASLKPESFLELIQIATGD